MGDLTEAEIFDCLSDNLKSAADSCEYLARSPKKGTRYIQLRKELKLIEGACRQAGHWRVDARWLQIGLYMEEAHRRAGDWLRGVKMPDGSRRPIVPGQLHPLFVKLAENLRAAHRVAEEYKTKRTNRVGAILPKPLAPPLRDTRPAGWNKTPSGILIPDSVGAA
jgi:hypothetical protein